MNVTTLIAHYNYDIFLSDCINSAYHQTVDNTICVVDDGSANQSSVINICNEILGEVSSINETPVYKLIEYSNGSKLILLKENGGPSRARNIGIYETLDESDAYMILDADDVMYADKIEICSKYMEINPVVGVVYADYDLYNIDTKNLITEHKPVYSRQHLERECIVHSGSLIRKQALIDAKDEFGFYDENMRTCEDYDLWIRISEKYMILHCPEVLTEVKVHNNNSTNSVQNEIWQANWQRIRDKQRVRYEQKKQ